MPEPTPGYEAVDTRITMLAAEIERETNFTKEKLGEFVGKLVAIVKDLKGAKEEANRAGDTGFEEDVDRNLAQCKEELEKYKSKVKGGRRKTKRRLFKKRKTRKQ